MLPVLCMRARQLFFITFSILFLCFISVFYFLFCCGYLCARCECVRIACPLACVRVCVRAECDLYVRVRGDCPRTNFFHYFSLLYFLFFVSDFVFVSFNFFAGASCARAVILLRVSVRTVSECVLPVRLPVCVCACVLTVTCMSCPRAW